MKRLQNLFQRSTPYLKRKHQFLNSRLSLPEKSDQLNINPFYQQSVSENSDTRYKSEEIYKQFLMISEELVADSINLRKLKIYGYESIYIGSFSQNLTQIIIQALNFQPVSKISNFVFHLCTRSQTFRVVLSKQLDKLILQPNKTYPQIIFLSDMFFFGIYCTQNQYINHIVINAFGFDQQTQQVNSRFDISHFVHYFNHYLRAIMDPALLHRRVRKKIMFIIDKYMLTKHIQDMVKITQQQQQALRNLRIKYTLYNQQQQGTKQISIIQKQMREAEMDFLHRNKMFRKIPQFYYFYWEVLLVNDPEKSQEKYKKFVKIGHQAGISLNSLIDYDEITDQQILMQIKASCLNYQNRKYYIQQEIYNITQLPLQFQPIKPTIQNPIPQIPQQFLNCLKICDTNQKCIQLAKQFLTYYNKHSNRQNLVWSVFKGMYERNNVLNIARVLAQISKIQPQIQKFINQKINRIKTHQNIDLNKVSQPFPAKYFLKYSSLIIEFCKFNLYDSQTYLRDLMKQINNKQTFQEQQLGLNQNFTAINLFAVNFSIISIHDIIDILSKLGRHIYYSSLQTHILFNQIIDTIYQGIRNRHVAYQVQIISRFNSIIMHLRSIKLKEQVIDLQIPLQQIKNEKKAERMASKYARSLKQKYKTIHFKEELQIIIQKIQKSVNSQNFISNFYYADLISKINSKALDKAVLNLTKNKINEKIKKTDIQGAVNWGRFLGELYAYDIIKQKDMFDICEKQIFSVFFSNQKAATIKIICSALDTCKDLLAKTESSIQMNRCLLFLLNIKKQLIKNKGLKNAIIEQQFVDLLQYFHPALVTFTSFQQIQNFIENTPLKELQTTLTSILKKQHKQPLKYKQAPNPKKQASPQTQNTQNDNQPMKIQPEYREQMSESPIKTKKIKIISRKINGEQKATKLISCDL